MRILVLPQCSAEPLGTSTAAARPRVRHNSRQMSQSFSQQFPAALTWAAIALLTYLLYLIVQPFLIPLGWGCVLAVLIYPAFGKLAVRVGGGGAAAAATLVTAIVLIAPGIALTNAFAREMIGI